MVSAPVEVARRSPSGEGKSAQRAIAWVEAPLQSVEGLRARLGLGLGRPSKEVGEPIDELKAVPRREIEQRRPLLG